MRLLKQSGRAVATTLVIIGAAVLGGCDTIKSNLLGATDPSNINPGAVQSPGGATAVKNGALSRLRSATADGESTWLFGGLLVDEWATSSTFVQNDETDQRSIQLSNATVNGDLRALYRVITDANQAVDLLNKWKPTPTYDIGEMYFARGFAELQLASDFCNGIPLSDGSGPIPIFGQPLPVKDVFGAASASFDTAIAVSALGLQKSKGDTAGATIILNASKIAKARALLGIGLSNAAAAAALVSGIPTTFHYDVTASITGGTNTLWDQPTSQNRYIIGDTVTGKDRSILITNAIPFFSAHDRRVPAYYKLGVKGDTIKAQDGGTLVIEADSLWGPSTAVPLTSGLDARLIEAEAALQRGDAAGMMSILNALRASPQLLTASSPTATGTHPGWTTPVMPALQDPGTPDGRVNLLFREKAFWTFSRGQRLGDLRRLIRDYGRKADGSDTGGYPIGQHYKGGVYGVDLNLPVTTDEQVGNTNFHGCLDRKA
jgi:hypothetical protein